MANDDAIRATNDDAAQCKRFAVEKGYWFDPYIQHFVSKGQNSHAPEINRGYYGRVAGIKHLMEKFLKITQSNCQIVNLGSGFDTTYWRLKNQGLAPKSFIEIDFPTVVMRKCHAIKKKRPLLAGIATEEERNLIQEKYMELLTQTIVQTRKKLELLYPRWMAYFEQQHRYESQIDAYDEIKYNNYDLHATDYHLVGANLRCLSEVESKLAESAIDYSLPTLFLAECVLVYLESEHSKTLNKWLAEKFTTAFYISYEQVNLGDKFGEVMLANLRSRECTLSGVEFCQSLDTQRHRFLSTGWEGADALEMGSVYKSLPHSEIARIERLEFLDERELLDQLFQHYCIVWAYKDKAALGLERIDFSSS